MHKNNDKVAREIEQTCLVHNFRKVTRTITQMYDDALKSSGLRSTQFTLLTALKLLQPITIGDLAERIYIDRTTLTRNLKILEDQGLIKFMSGEDLRKREILLTNKGLKKHEIAIPLWRDVQKIIYKKYGKIQSENLVSNLTDLLIKL